jgi:hypothetical protein
MVWQIFGVVAIISTLFLPIGYAVGIKWFILPAYICLLFADIYLLITCNGNIIAIIIYVLLLVSLIIPLVIYLCNLIKKNIAKKNRK